MAIDVGMLSEFPDLDLSLDVADRARLAMHDASALLRQRTNRISNGVVPLSVMGAPSQSRCVLCGLRR